MNIPDCNFFLVDIDGTLTKCREDTEYELLYGNFLFPVIRDLMLESGWEKKKAEDAILELSNTNIFWDYPDFIAEFNLPVQEAFRRFRQWHTANIRLCGDGISLVRHLHSLGRKLFIMSNNPYIGCLLKLQAAGLAENDFQSPYFERIFGTNILRGCKDVPEVWKRALALIPADRSDICTVGDNPEEDGEIPGKCGIGNRIILPRKRIEHGIENTMKGQL